ncbi:vesicle transport protein SEC20 [Vespa crabro]|uniref:vesicle transport protein SEC20 n=1 Tax=Vespa crabro TaxID=7445 RepID=UPI001F02AFC8|nr:vesicle transport protein SEC20 [Vespa crabro]XP_046835133.1 vesicle transport protein SEC20 [Vespa crabro]XP_046835134.1 vesicle transport protein SEC20 [Vespa crabro]XP_046835135.1 vesicle transport protein SEC20 [Vespa crabro]
MDINNNTELIRQEIIKNHLQFTALIQDIQQCTGPLELLNELNAEGREKITALRSSIDKLTSLAETEINENERTELLAEVETYKKQLTASLGTFRKANVISACIIDKLAREDLLSISEEQQNALRKRRDKQGLASASNQVTDKLLSISRHLAETTQKSGDTLDTLLTSSDKVSSTKNELEHQQQVIVQSGKLLGKYGRREVTDKVLLVLAFAFFLACVFYILQKRLF